VQICSHLCVSVSSYDRTPLSPVRLHLRSSTNQNCSRRILLKSHHLVILLLAPFTVMSNVLKSKPFARSCSFVSCLEITVTLFIRRCSPFVPTGAYRLQDAMLCRKPLKALQINFYIRYCSRKVNFISTTRIQILYICLNFVCIYYTEPSISLASRGALYNVYIW
jgi:hypothetical protein